MGMHCVVEIWICLSQWEECRTGNESLNIPPSFAWKFSHILMMRACYRCQRLSSHHRAIQCQPISATPCSSDRSVYNHLCLGKVDRTYRLEFIEIEYNYLLSFTGCERHQCLLSDPLHSFFSFAGQSVIQLCTMWVHSLHGQILISDPEMALSLHDYKTSNFTYTCRCFV